MREEAIRLGATYRGDRTCRFRVWAPQSNSVDVHLVKDNRRVTLSKGERGYHEAIVAGVAPEDGYLISLEGKTGRPDPASRLQPDGVHGPSAVVDDEFPWEEPQWSGPELPEYAIYELHVGMFSPAGTFEGAIPYLS